MSKNSNVYFVSYLDRKDIQQYKIGKILDTKGKTITIFMNETNKLIIQNNNKIKLIKKEDFVNYFKNKYIVIDNNMYEYVSIDENKFEIHLTSNKVINFIDFNKNNIEIIDKQNISNISNTSDNIVSATNPKEIVPIEDNYTSKGYGTEKIYENLKPNIKIKFTYGENETIEGVFDNYTYSLDDAEYKEKIHEINEFYKKDMEAFKNYQNQKKILEELKAKYDVLSEEEMLKYNQDLENFERKPIPTYPIKSKEIEFLIKHPSFRLININREFSVDSVSKIEEHKNDYEK